MIPYGRQEISADDIKAVTESLNAEFLTTGPLVDSFERQLESYVGAPCVSVSSGTAALHCAYAAIGIGPGDEVITPPLTFIATQATAAQLGARIVFADILPDTGTIDPEQVERKLTARTKAIVAVDYAGHPAELTELRKIADSRGIYLIEDAAHSIGSLYRGRPVGSIAHITTFSFFPTKNLTTGEGGAVSSADPDILGRVKKFSRQGLIRDSLNFKITGEGPWHQEVQEFGLNYRLPDILCALGISQLRKADFFKQRRREIFRRYSEAFNDLDQVILPTEKAYVDTNWHLFPIRVSPNRRLEIFKSLRESSVGVQVNYLPAHWHPVFSENGYAKEAHPVSENFYKSEISIPMSASLTEKELQHVIKSVRKAVREKT